MRRFFIPCMIVLFMAGACTVQESEKLCQSENHQELVFTAESGEEQTKTAFQADETSIWWSPRDQICIYYGPSTGNKFTATNENEVAKAVFRGTLDAFTGEAETGEALSFWAVYPFQSAISCDGSSVIVSLSDQQVAKAGSFAPNTNISLAKSPGMNLSFFNVCSWFRFSVKKEGIKTVSFKGNNGEIVAGKFGVSIGEDKRPTVPTIIDGDGKTEIVLSAPSGKTFEVGKMYYITLLPQVFTNGFTVTLETDTEIGSRSINSKATFLRSKYNTGVDFDKNVDYSDKDPGETPGDGSEENNPTVNTRVFHAVDLGLSVMWADCNVGATRPEEYGEYLAWGEVAPKSDYAWSTYEWGNLGAFTKYNTVSDFGSIDYLTSLELKDDAATNERGVGWRAPSFSEFDELINNCNWEWTDSYNGSGVRGFIISGKKEGYIDNHIFMPAGGFLPYQYTWPYWFRERLLYWSRDVVQNNPMNAWYLIYYENGYELHDDGNRQWGKLVRPVYTGETAGWVETTSIQLDKTSVAMDVGDVVQLNASLVPDNSTCRRLRWKSSDESVATVDSDGFVTACRNGKAKISVSSYYGSVVGSCDIIVGAVSSIVLNKKETTIFIGDNEQLLADIQPEDAADKTIIWSSSNPSVVEVDDSGNLIPHTEGNAIITATAGDCSDQCSVYVLSKENHYIDFKDSVVEAICLANWDADGNGRLSYQEASSVTVLNNQFYKRTDIISFDELQYFSNLKRMNYGFSGCSNLNSIILPRSLQELCFSGCKSLKEIIIPESVTTIGNNAFGSCTSLTSISIPESVTTIESSAFQGCTSLASVSIPESVTTIKGSAFANCTRLSSIIIPESVTTIGNSAFSGCSSLASVSIPKSVTTIGSSAFQGCTSLASIIIPESVTTIESSAFQGCTSLASVSIPESVTTIKGSAFANCTRLSSIIIPESVTTIGNNVFWCCALTSIIIPESVTEIGSKVFGYCTFLTSITVISKTPPRINNEILYNLSSCIIYVPYESVDAYKTADNWNVYADRIQAIIE